MGKWTKIAAAGLAGVAVVLLLYAILTEESATTDDSHMGMGDSHIYSSTNLAIIVFASFVIAVAVAFILLREEYEPLPPSMVRTLPPPPPPEAKAASPDAVTVPEKPVAPRPPEPEPRAPAEPTDPETKARESYLVLRLLTGDERLMFKAIMDSGGEALQKDLIQRTKMSNAKVSRLLDRLDEKGVITKERHGSTNKIRIKLE